MKTADKILNKALEMFNAEGIEYVGLRELAALLGIRVGNITYYFPTKDDLVNRLSLDLNQLNSQIVVNTETLSLLDFFDIFTRVFQNHQRYRCLLLSFVHLMEQNKLISERYVLTEKKRAETLREQILQLRKNGYLRPDADEALDFLVSNISLIVRFWISEAAISLRHLSPSAQLAHNIQLMATLLRPYATDKGLAEIDLFIKNQK